MELDELKDCSYKPSKKTKEEEIKQELIKKAEKWSFKNIYKHIDDDKLSMTFRHTEEAIEKFQKNNGGIIMEFKSQLCTNIYQSERLLKLGLDRETADMFHLRVVGHAEDEFDVNNFAECTEGIYDIHSYPSEDTIPAWSLHKLIDLMPEYIHLDAFEDTKYYLTLRPSCLLKVCYKQDIGNWLYGSESSNLFDAIIDVIEYLIIGKYFDKQYLK